MMRKLLTMALSITLIATLAACGAGTSATGADSGGTVGEAATAATGRAEWSLSEIAGLGDIVTGITDREYGAGEGSARRIREDITYDREFIHTVLLDTASVRFDTPGGYPMTYWVYFDAAALADRTDAADMGFDIPDADRLAVAVHATVTVTDPEEDEGDGADEGPEETEAVEAVIGSSGGGSGSGSGSSSKSSGSSASACDHVWYEVVDAETGEHLLACSECGAEKAMSSGSSSGSSGSSSKSSSSGSSGSSSKSSTGSGSGSSSSSSGGSSSSSGSQTAGCSHVWVEVTEEVNVREGRYVCNNCGFYTLSVPEILAHCGADGNCGYHSALVTVGTETVGTGTYVCSKCGATK